MRFNNRMFYALAIAIMVGVLMFPATSYADGEPIRYKDDKSREEFDAQYNWNLMISSDTSDNSEFESERQFLTSSFLVEAASNQDYTEGDYVIELKENAVTIKRYIGEETGTLTVPREVQGYPVTEIDEKAFQYCNASSIVLPDTVTKIGTEAFYACRRITTFETPASVTSMGYWAFYCCNNLESVTIPASLITFNGNPFDGCNKLKTIIIDSGNQKYSMYGHALIETENMLLVTYEYGHVGETLTIPDGIKTVGAEAFGYAGPNFKKLIIPDSVETISGSAFCFSNAVTIEIGAGVKQMDYGAFCYSHSLKSVVIAEGTTCIGGNAFSNCENLETITIPDSVTSIAQNAFDGDYKLHIIAKPRSYAASFATEQEINLQYSLEGMDVMYLPENTQLIQAQAFASTACEAVIVPESCVSIGPEAFSGCSRLVYIKAPQATEIAEDAFAGCSELLVVDRY